MFQNTKKLFLLVQWAVAKINKKWWMKNPEAVTRRFSQWCNLTLIQRFWATNVCLQAFGHPTGRATCWKANFENYSIFFDTMVSILINIIQPEQYYLIILLIGLKAATLLKKRLWHRYFPAKFLGTTFFIEHIRAAAFGLSFVNTRKKFVKELV